MKYFEERKGVKYIHTSKKNIEKEIVSIGKKVDIIIEKLNNKK